MSDIIAKLEPSLGRRWFGVIMLSIVGVALFWILLTHPPRSFFLQIVLVVLGALFFWQARWNLRVTRTGLYLTHFGIFDGEDNLICAMDNMLEIDRGLFAFKPSNGFLVRMIDPEAKAWAPGLYWRLGRRLGIGGATQPAQAKAMADAIAIMIQERSMGPDSTV